MASRVYCSKSVLAAAAQGDALPSLAAVLAYVQACGGDVTDWQRRWRELVAALALPSAEARPGAPALDEAPEPESEGVGATGSWRSLSYPRGLLPERVRGRSALVGALRRLVTAPDGRLHVLTGMGGCGKTTVALSVAEQAARGARVWWISARDDTSLTASLVDLATALGVPTGEIQQALRGVHSLTDLVWQRLEATRQAWLLVVDNADEPELLAADGGLVRDGTGVIRGSRRGLVLVTTRVGEQATWGDAAVLHPVGMLDDTDGGQVLRDLAPHAGVVQQAEALAARLGGLPLALRAAGRYLSSAGARLDRVTTFADYRDALETRFKALLGDTAGSVGPRDVVMTTWEFSLDWLAGRGLPQARTLMRLLGGGFAAAPLPVSVLDRLAFYDSVLFVPGALDAGAPRRLATAARAWLRSRLGRPPRYDEQLHRRCVAALCHLGLLDLIESGAPDDTATCLAAHPLVSEVNAAWVAGDRTLARHVHETAAILLSQSASGRESNDADEFIRWPLLAPHLAHALTQTAHPLPPPMSAALVEASILTVHGLNHAGDTPTAATLGEITAHAATARLSPDHPARVTVGFERALTLQMRGQIQRSEEQLRALLPDAVRATGPDSLLTLRIRLCLAISHQQMGRYEEAFAACRDLLPDVERALGRDSRLAVITRSNIADALLRTGRYEEADAEHRQLLAIVEALDGWDSEVLFSRYGLASVLAHQGLHGQAVAAFRDVVAAATLKLGPEHPDTLQIRAGLADALARQGRDGEAEAEFGAVLVAQDQILGAGHPRTADTRMSYAEFRTRLAQRPPAAAQ